MAKAKAKSKKSVPDDSSTIEWLAQAIGQATRSSRYCVAGTLGKVDPEIEVDGLGLVQFPLKPAAVKKLVARCQTAPYGKGTQTLVDTKVRKTFELDPKSFRLGDGWKAAIAEATGPIAEQLGLPADRLEARLYKLLVYEKGGFFLPHRDSEKDDRMVASLIVVLPNRFYGGGLVVRHGNIEQMFDFTDAAAQKSPSYAAFYADCEHEVKRVDEGVRICLAYNLVLNQADENVSLPASDSHSTDIVARSLGAWVVKQPTEPLVFALEHHYTERGLSLDLLKGADRGLADTVVSAAPRADGVVYLAQVTRHQAQFADDGSYGYSRYDRPRRRQSLEIGETYEDEFNGTEWADIKGEKQPWGTIGLDKASIVSTTPIDDWKPTSEEYEGYNGNAGNTLDRWYHRSAIVVWHRDHHYDVIAGCGTASSIPLFRAMASKLAKTPKKRLEEARLDCIRFARAIIARWPRQVVPYRHSIEKEKPDDVFSKYLLALSDRDTIAMFLTKLTQWDVTLRLTTLIPEACREFGWDAFAEELKQLLAPPSETHLSREIPLRDVEWLSTFCCDPTIDPRKSALARDLCELAVERFCDPPSAHHRYSYNLEPTVPEKSLGLLLQALMAAGLGEGLSRVLNFVDQSPETFRMDECQVPTLKTLIPWSRERFSKVPARLAGWLKLVRGRLESATAKKPEPPTDWARSAHVDCKCRYCAVINAFLANPAEKDTKIAAGEDIRQHMIGIIQKHQCDIKHSLERTRRPYILALTKTTGSFERALKRYEMDRQLLSELPA